LRLRDTDLVSDVQQAVAKRDSSAGPAATRLQRLLCSECFKGSDRGPAQEAEDADLNHEADEQAVEALLALASEAVADERERGRALDTKTSSITGFTALVLSINVTLGRPLLAQDLGRLGHPVASACFVLAVAALTLALGLALVGVLMPQKFRSLNREALREFGSAHTQAQSRLWVHQRMLGAYADILDQDRTVNDCKAKITKLVALALLVGFLAVAGQAFTLGLRQMGL
jgi:hypothetical protein